MQSIPYKTELVSDAIIPCPTTPYICIPITYLLYPFIYSHFLLSSTITPPLPYHTTAFTILQSLTYSQYPPSPKTHTFTYNTFANLPYPTLPSPTLPYQDLPSPPLTLSFANITSTIPYNSQSYTKPKSPTYNHLSYPCCVTKPYPTLPFSTIPYLRLPYPRLSYPTLPNLTIISSLLFFAILQYTTSNYPHLNCHR